METEYTVEQLEILHKLTTFKYNPSPEGLITLAEYEKLDTFLKGYAFYLQSGWEGSPIPKFKIRALSFADGMEKARTEVGASSLKPRRGSITATTIASIIKQELKLKDLPMGESFFDLGFSNQNLEAIQRRFLKTFNHTVPVILFKETVLDLTERMNQNKPFAL